MAHCADCWTEFVEGITTCSDCGQPLSPGPLPESDEEETTPAVKPSFAAIDTFFDELPGERAEFAASVLKLEGIHCRLECEGLVQYRGPDAQPQPPIAVTLPVRIYVAATDVERVREIVASTQEEDLIGESWNEVPAEENLAEESRAEEVASETEPEAAGRVEAPEAENELAGEVRAESNTTLIVVFIVALIALLFMFRR